MMPMLGPYGFMKQFVREVVIGWAWVVKEWVKAAGKTR